MQYAAYAALYIDNRPKQTFSLFRVLADAIGIGYIDAALET
jgi:hypothetical protein